jgi:hypothetical protein
VRQEVRSFTTTTAGLLAVGDWLKDAGCTHASSEWGIMSPFNRCRMTSSDSVQTDFLGGGTSPEGRWVRAF